MPGADRWATVERLYHAAQALSVDRRAPFLAEACPDESIRREVESLLAQHGSANDALTRGAVAAAAGLVSDIGRSMVAGRRFGVYQVLAPLGAGGMGEVYRARDTRLGRDVAIKIVPHEFSSLPDRLARCEREARMLAALNHPHIAAIYGIEDDQGIHALVLELVDGETLAERIARGPLRVADALAIARQIADALDAAHEKGIVHRDLKPANIKITPEGVVKVLDFGLAKLEPAGSGQLAAGSPLTASPTITVDGTHAGLIVGTAAYMSPEQARGLPVDKRTDIWAFGCVLYEMLTGRMAFARDTLTDTLAAVLEHEPAWDALPPNAPIELHQLLRHTLQKDPRNRLRDIADSRPVLGGSIADAPSGAPARRQSLGRYVPWLIAAAALTVAFALAIETRRQSADAPQEVIDSRSLVPLTLDSGLTTTEPSISADGRLIAYASNRSGEGNLDIWVQQVTGGAASRVAADPTDDHQPNLSPDGSLVAYRSERNGGGVYVVSPLGGESRLVAPRGMAPRFSPDGHTLAFWTGLWLAPRGIVNVRHVFVVPTNGGEPRQIASQMASAGDPIWAPDGRSLLVFARTAIAGAGTNPDWWWVPLDGEAPVKTGAYDRFETAGIEVSITDAQPYPGDWTSNGVLFAARVKDSETDRIWRIQVDQQTGRALGEPIEITAGTTIDSGPGASRDGRLVFAASSTHYVLLGLPLDANRGKAEGVQKTLRDDIAPTRRSAMSDDGHLLVFPLYSFGSGSVSVKDLDTGRERQLVATPPVPLNPVISRSGRWVAYTVTTTEEGGNAGPGTGYIIATNEGTPRKVCDDCQIFQWTGDEGGVVVLEGRPFRGTLIDVRTGQHMPVLSGVDGLDRPILAPNERWISFGTPKGTLVTPFRPGTNTAPEAAMIATLRGAERGAGWSPDSRLLYLLLETDGFRCLYAVSIDPLTGRSAGEPFAVYHFHDASRRWGSTGYGNAVTPRWFLSDQFEFTGNVWMAMLKR